MMQYYGILEDRKTAVYVAMTPDAVRDFARKYPEERIVYLADRFHIIEKIQKGRIKK